MKLFLEMVNKIKLH